MQTLSVTAVRRLALARAGLLKPEWTGLALKTGRGRRQALTAAHRVINRFGYLQLDSVSVSGARTHGLVLLSRLDRFDPGLAETLLGPGEPLFEYWGHEASWIPLDLWPVFAFRRSDFSIHPWWGDLLGRHPEVADELLSRLADEGPLRSSQLSQQTRSGWWDLGVVKKVASALWSKGDICVRARRGFQRTWDLTERVIPDTIRGADLARSDALRVLVLKAFDGHGWATTTTVVNTWRLSRHRQEVQEVLRNLESEGLIRACEIVGTDQRQTRGWVRPEDLDLAERLLGCRPQNGRGVLLSPFDPVLWDRDRVGLLFAFDQILEIYKPRAVRRWGYYCLPVLSGDRLVGRVDLKAHRREGRLEVLSRHLEAGVSASKAVAATESAVNRLGDQLALEVDFSGIGEST